LEGKREELLKCQIKIQENKLATENLADINKSVSDMMIRQMELKRSIIELEI
jgi:phenylpyruvate tautomerase PptA (4-oxalocrotonate tautomerase family)